MSLDPPKIENLIKLIEHQIASGQLKPGERLPSLVQLKVEHDISYQSVRLAMDRLKASGAIRSHPGKGFYVSDE